MKKLSLLSVLLLVLMGSCSKKSNPSPANKNPSDTIKTTTTTAIYISGTTGSGTAFNAAYWKNGQLTLLTPAGQNSWAYAITSQGTDVYVAGSAIINNVQTAVYWKNGNMVTLQAGEALTITVSGSDVYVAGYTRTTTRSDVIDQAVYWKNGTAVPLTNPVQDLSDGTPPCCAQSILVNGSDVYVAGWGEVFPNSFEVAIYWKNGVGKGLTDFLGSDGNLNSSSQAFSITLNGADVYIAGYITPATGTASSFNPINGAVYWKNGSPVSLIASNTYPMANGIAFKDGTMYISGDLYSNAGGVFWQNTDKISLQDSEQNSQSTSIGLNETNVYITGDIYNTDEGQRLPVYWKNGVQVLLTSTTPGQATGITFVQQ